MNAFKALSTISGYIDMLNNMGVLTDEELAELMEAESTLLKYIKEYET